MALHGKIIDREQLAALCLMQRAKGARVVLTNGCFDVLHAGHVLLLEQARAWGDFLAVGLNSDASVRRLKGPTRPVHDEESRALVLAALSAVDAVCLFDEDTPDALIRAVRPHLHVKGGDYSPRDLPEAQAVREVGGEIRIVPVFRGYSSTAAVDRWRVGPVARDTPLPAVNESQTEEGDTPNGQRNE